MAVKETIQVDESQKSEPGVQEVITPVPVGSEIVKKATYWRSVLQDDLNPEVTDGVTTVKLAVPALVEEEYETGETNEDGSAKLGVRQVRDMQWYDIDLGEESLTALEAAIRPFTEVARKAEAPGAKPVRKKRTTK
ncbi:MULTISPECIES: hypothetical protein [unclassified Streptomyces]|uniref:hypothetical protein n=1 Tax=unclassified Streptomyces TaxID=2593676 RepID=UPI000C274DF5|nr:hypothetical protein [Streptomyces sp. CB02959]PJN39647.1 hypothetical protein CG747_17120 [Streptomyces sp. CB02959]